MSKGPPSDIVTRPAVSGLSRFDIIADEAADVKRIKPVPTVWGRNSGRPIYDRLPGVSEGYRLEFSGEENSGFVYIDPQFGTLRGSGSLEVGAWTEDPHYLILQSGTITWQFGQVPTDTLVVDLRTIVDGGVQDGDYQVGYYLGYEIPETTSGIFSVENHSLASSKTTYSASSVGPDSPVSAMFSDIDARSWKPDLYGRAGSYESGSSVIMDFGAAVRANSFNIGAQSTGQQLAKCALYLSNDGIIWYLEDSRAGKDLSWVVNAQSESQHRYWRLFFWDGFVSAAQVLYTGEASFPIIPSSSKISVVEPFLEGKFDELEDRPYIRLGEIEVKNQEIVKVTDSRRTTSTKYEPVAQWLTSFQDESLRKLFTSIERYSTEYMSPISGGDYLYDDLVGRNGIILGSDTDAQVPKLPGIVELEPGTQIITDAELLADPLEDNVGTDPAAFQVFAEGITVYRSSSAITPSQVILLGDPEEASDLAPKSYVDTTFVLKLDNGAY